MKKKPNFIPLTSIGIKEVAVITHFRNDYFCLIVDSEHVYHHFPVSEPTINMGQTKLQACVITIVKEGRKTRVMSSLEGRR